MWKMDQICSNMYIDDRKIARIFAETKFRQICEYLFCIPYEVPYLGVAVTTAACELPLQSVPLVPHLKGQSAKRL